MGVLKWTINILDYILTMLAGWIMVDILYQFGMHFLLHLEDPWNLFLELPQIALQFRPNVDRVKLGLMVVKKAYYYLINWKKLMSKISSWNEFFFSHHSGSLTTSPFWRRKYPRQKISLLRKVLYVILKWNFFFSPLWLTYYVTIFCRMQNDTNEI